jgi:hypothetical protein
VIPAMLAGLTYGSRWRFAAALDRAARLPTVGSANWSRKGEIQIARPTGRFLKAGELRGMA